MKFTVESENGWTISSHRKWERAVDAAVTNANKFRKSSNRIAYSVFAIEKNGSRWLFSRSVFVPNLEIGNDVGCVQTTFETRSIPIRYEVER